MSSSNSNHEIWPITEKAISQRIGRNIKSPVFVGDLRSLDIPVDQFLQSFAPHFKDLPWDLYDVRRAQLEFLQRSFPAEIQSLNDLFPPFFQGKTGLEIFQSWIDQLSEDHQQLIKNIKPWRRRSIAQFRVEEIEGAVSIKRQPVDQFTQETHEKDLRALPRIFAEAPAHHVENELFYLLINKLYHLVKQVRTDLKALQMTTHFMGVMAREGSPGDNAPEGAHEDGADYIVSALVINRTNLSGGESQVIEKVASGEKEVILRHILQPGEFIFQTDSRDEIVYGTDLWHYITPFHVLDTSAGPGWRDIIGFDIDVLP